MLSTIFHVFHIVETLCPPLQARELSLAALPLDELCVRFLQAADAALGDVGAVREACGQLARQLEAAAASGEPVAASVLGSRAAADTPLARPLS